MSDTPAPVVETPTPAAHAAPQTPPEAPPSPDAKPPVEAPPAPNAEEAKMSARFAALARREKGIQSRESEWKAKEKAWEAKIARAEAAAALEEKILENPFELLNHYKVNFQQLTDAAIKHGQPKTPEERVSEVEAKFAAKEAAETKAAQDRAHQESERVITEFRANIDRTIAADTDKYELIHAQKKQDLVWEVIEANWQATAKQVAEGGRDAPELLDVDVAATMVESYLYDEAKALLALKKFAPKEPTPAPPAKVSPFARKPAPPTLSSPKLTAAIPPPQSFTHETHEQKIERIAAKMKMARLQKRA